MRVLFVSNLYPPNVVGGYERLCFEVASAFVERGHEVHVLASGHGGGTAEYPGQTIRRTLRLLAGESIYAPFPGGAAARSAFFCSLSCRGRHVSEGEQGRARAGRFTLQSSVSSSAERCLIHWCSSDSARRFLAKQLAS